MVETGLVSYSWKRFFEHSRYISPMGAAEKMVDENADRHRGSFLHSTLIRPFTIFFAAVAAEKAFVENAGLTITAGTGRCDSEVRLAQPSRLVQPRHGLHRHSPLRRRRDVVLTRTGWG
jgi:hypothetical protein